MADKTAKNRGDLEESLRRCKEFMDFLHDLDGTRRGQPAFNDPALAKARGHIEEAAHLVARFVREKEAAA